MQLPDCPEIYRNIALEANPVLNGLIAITALYRSCESRHTKGNFFILLKSIAIFQ